MEDQLSNVFKALGHPIRREILDLLKQSSRTTGDLDAYFPDVSRYAIMKHLSVLQDAHLVIVRREGKYRLNYLNAVPLQEVHSRWVGQYTGAAAQSLLNVKSVVEKNEGGREMKTNEQASVFKIEQEVVIDGSREEVFKALTENVQDWWEFRIAPEGKPSELSLNPVVGGQFLEKWGQDEGAVWGNVYYVNAPEEIRLYGHLGMQGAVNSAYTYQLTENDGSTTLKLTHTASGLIEEDWEPSHREGWNHLLGTLLKNYVEQK